MEMDDLVALRKQLGIKQSEVGDAMGYTAHSCIAQAETGARKPSAEFVAKYKSALMQICESKSVEFYEAKKTLKAIKADKALRWRCSKCGAWHENQGYYRKAIGVKIPNSMDESGEGYCPEGCPLLIGGETERERCRLGLHEQPQSEYKSKPGCGCPVVMEASND